jgi:hypothetical protein
MGWLTAHDVLPRWQAQELPRVRPAALAFNGPREAQYAIRGPLGEIGAIWTQYLIDRDSVRRDDLIWIERLPVDIVPLRLGISSVFTADGLLDEFTVRMEYRGIGQPIKLHGERFHADFSFTIENGPYLKAFKIPLKEGGWITEAFNPFAGLRDLRVGQTWRMQVFNPVAALTGLGSRFIPLLVQVTGEERIQSGGWEGNCLVVESANARAWVSADGEVRVQEMTLPMIGTIRIERQVEFDAARRNAARKAALIGS